MVSNELSGEYAQGQSEQLAREVAMAVVSVDQIAQSQTSDPAVAPLARQLQNNLRHTGFRFEVARDSEDYPYHVPTTSGYEPVSTRWALKRAQRFQQLTTQETDTSAAMPEFSDEQLTEIQLQQQLVVERLLDDPVEIYAAFKERVDMYGEMAPFPELGWTVKGLLAEMATGDMVADACDRSPVLARLRQQLASSMTELIAANDYAYTDTLYAIEDAVAFFDIVVRTTNPKAPPLFHSERFEYNWHELVQSGEHIVLPTMASVNSTDLLRLRGVPVGLIGVSPQTLTVDGFPQTPYEFFMHDVDHTRRMHAETRLGIEREGVDDMRYAQDATALLHDVLLPAVDVDGITDEQERDRRIAMRMILFEILHEDAYDPTRDTIAEAILRPPLERTPFERIREDGVVEYYMAPRATTLGHVFRKLAHTFYDLPERRSTTLGTDYVRTRAMLARGAADLYKLVSDDPIEYDALLTTCEDLIATDEGFSDAFIGNISHDINQRAVGRDRLRLMIVRPLGVASAVRKVRSYAPRIHSLFGYSALEYQDPLALERQVMHDLAQYDPEETAIAIGATPYGIGRLYPAIKQLGYTTLGIVASTALGKNEECADGVDDIIVVRDSGWGGYRYAQANGGLLSPTTRVFVGASDSIAAYGGGNITAVTLEEAKRRGKAVSFTPFDMNHRIADILHAQHGETGEIDYRGPAHARWNAR